MAIVEVLYASGIRVGELCGLDIGSLDADRQVLRVRGKGDKAPQRPWEGAEGLEWEVPSPAPFHTFEEPPKLDATATRVIG